MSEDLKGRFRAMGLATAIAVVIIGVGTVLGIGLEALTRGEPEPPSPWEYVDTWTQRMPVPPGWIVRRSNWAVFVPDPEHEWEIR